MSFVFFFFLVTPRFGAVGENITKTLRCSASTLTSTGVIYPSLINNMDSNTSPLDAVTKMNVQMQDSAKLRTFLDVVLLNNG